MKTYKTLLVGEGGCGKSTWVARLNAEKNGSKLFEQKYIATLGVEVVPVIAQSPSDGSKYIANIWDCAGQDKFSGLGDGYYVQAQAAIFAFNLDSRRSMKKIPQKVREVRRITGDIPYVIVGFKSDVRTISQEEVRAFLGNANYVEVSTKTGSNVHEPLRILHRRLNPSVNVGHAKL